jgi:hypothetical protein
MIDGSLVIVAATVLILVGLAVGLFTPSGSGIAPRPWSGRGASSAPGADGPEEVSGRDEGEHTPMQHGTR